jgi:hypothetical protein
MNFFAMIKKLTLVGYYPSEAGFKDELHKSTIPTKHHMGRDPKTSVLNAHNQAHDVKNLFVTDGSFMASSSCVNPSPYKRQSGFRLKRASG